MVEQTVIEIKRINFSSYARTNCYWYDRNKFLFDMIERTDIDSIICYC